MPGAATIDVHYVTERAENFPVHGVYGGAAPQGYIVASFFVERLAVPKHSKLNIAVGDDHRVASSVEETIEAKEGIVRVVTATHYMDLEMAENVANWLLSKVAEVKALRGE